VRIAVALGNRPDMNIAVINVPAFMAVVCGSAAGEGGHVGIEALSELASKSPHRLGSKHIRATADGGVDKLVHPADDDRRDLMSHTISSFR
jgi:hypothetical protein